MVRFRDKFGRFTADGRKIKTATKGKRTIRNKHIIRKLFKTYKTKITKPKVRKPKLRKIQFKIDSERYASQIDRLGGLGETLAYTTKVDWFSVNEEKTFIDTFKKFLKTLKIPKLTYRVKLGITLEDKVQPEKAVSDFTDWMVYFFDLERDFDYILRELFDNVKEEIDYVLELAEKYNVKNLGDLTLHAMFTVGERKFTRPRKRRR